jgi:hypothetical protein
MLIQRIESGETARGIPDLYLRTAKREYWIELKNIKRASVHNTTWRIPWRSGQLAWAQQYHRFSRLESYTIVALKDGYIIIPMTSYKNHTSHTVYSSQCIRMTQLSDIVDCILEGLEHYVY